MPKIYDRRIDKAFELLRMLYRGPAGFCDFNKKVATDEEARSHYQLWAKAWIIPLVKKLVPELRRLSDDEIRVALDRINSRRS